MLLPTFLFACIALHCTFPPAFLISPWPDAATLLEVLEVD